MELFPVLAVFVVVSLSITLAGLKMWVRPREAVDRLVGVTPAVQGEKPPVHPSLTLRDILLKFGSKLPASPKDLSQKQRWLVRAGFRTEAAIRVLYGAKLALALVMPVIASPFVVSSGLQTGEKVFLIVAAAFTGFILPGKYVSTRAGRRQKAIRKGLPDALDLMVVCVESGLGLDQAIMQVAKELEHAHPDIAEEFALVNLELKAGKRRAEALRNLAERTASDELKKLVAVLLQADRFGTGVAGSLRAHADYMRVQARQTVEEKAAKLGVKLVFPIFFCILPSLFVVTVGPVVVRIMRELLPAMKKF